MRKYRNLIVFKSQEARKYQNNFKVPKNNDSSGENLDIQESIINKIRKKLSDQRKNLSKKLY